MQTGDCIPDETIYTVIEFNQLKKDILTAEAGIREIQFADKRTVFRSMAENRELINIMAEAIWGHCQNYRRRSVIVTSKGLC